MPRSTKRKRAPRVQTEIPDEEEVEVVSDDGEPELDSEESEEGQEENGDAPNHQFEVEAEIWDLFREEFHEGAFCCRFGSCAATD